VTNQYPEQSSAVLALVLGILGLVSVGLLAPFACWIGRAEEMAIADGRRDPANLQMATAGKVLGIVGTILLALGVFVLILALALGVFFVTVGS
jgi:hypothetical protein